MAATQFLSPVIGPSRALVAGLTVALAPVVWATRAFNTDHWSATCARLGFGLVLGFLLLPLILLPIGSIGLALDLRLPPQSPAMPRLVEIWLVGVLLAPIWEELLYRKVLLLELSASIGQPLALLLVTSLFAASHVAPWSVLGTAAAGLVLGLVMLASGSAALCIGLHAGLNLAALVGGIPPWRYPLPLPVVPFALLATLLIGVSLRRRSRLRRAWVASGIAALVGAFPCSALAEIFDWQGELTFERIGLPTATLTGAGVANLNAPGAGAHLTSLALTDAILGSTILPVTDPIVSNGGLVAVGLAATVGTGGLGPFGQTAPPSQAQLTRAELPIRGEARLCFLSPACAGGGLTLPLSMPSRSAAVGVGGLLTVGGLGTIRVSALAAPWTVRTASIPVHTEGGATIGLPAAGWVHGPLSFTSSTAASGGAVSLVTPLRVTSVGGSQGNQFAGFARLTIRFVPEPRSLFLLGAGTAALAVLAHSRRRSRQSAAVIPAAHEEIRS